MSQPHDEGAWATARTGDDLWDDGEPLPPDPDGAAHYEELAAVLGHHPEYRVLRRFHPRDSYRLTLPGVELRTGLMVDCETTGLDVEEGGDKIIEAGLLPFTFDARNGRVFDVLPGYSGLEDPGSPLAPEICEITGITDGDLLGRKMDEDAVFKLASSAAIVFAKSARFDRPMFEKRWPFFASMPWGCVQEEVPWRGYGFRDRRLGSLLGDVCGEFFDGHRALDDCHAAVRLLTAELGDRPALSYLLENARTNTWRVRADVPRGYNLALKARGYQAMYRHQRFQYWWRDVTGEQFPIEQDWLVRHCEAQPPVLVKKVTSLSRYSLRV